MLDVHAPVRESRARLDISLTVITVVLALVHTWAGRYSMSPDGISYLDVGTAFVRKDWFGAFNAYWSPLYAWLQGVAMVLVKPAIRWEFPLAHIVNFIIFLVTLASFQFFYRSCLNFRRHTSHQVEAGREFLPDWAIILLAYPIFWWASFELTPLYEVGPDLALSACVYASAATLMRARMSKTWREFSLLGFVLGVGYWVKAPFFPLAFLFLIVAYVWARHEQRWTAGLSVSLAVFLVTASPLLIALSLQKHRPTFGDSARLNYAWFIAPQSFHRNWQGREPGSGTPIHPTHQVLDAPPVYTFQGPVIGTYPPWLDPSYWNEGLRPSLSLKAQLRALATDLMTEASLILRAQPALLVSIVLLLMLSGAGVGSGIRLFWPLGAFSLGAFALYAPVHVEPRFLGGFVLLLFLMPIMSVDLRPADLRAGRFLAVAAFAVMLLGTLDTAYRYATFHPLVPGNGPASAVRDVTVATQLRQAELLPGDSVAIVGDGTGAYWARLAKLHIVAEVMAADHNAQQFWAGSETIQKNVLKLFAAAGAKAVVADNPPITLDREWVQIANTNCYLRRIGDMSVHP